MQTPREKETAPEQKPIEQKVQKLRELYADAPELGKVALENGLPAFRKRELATATGAQSAGRIGARQGKVSELTGIFPFAKGGAKRLRGLLQLLEGNFQGADAVGTVHDMRFVFLDNDTKLLFATTYDGEWDAYIDDFATKNADAWTHADSAMRRGGRAFAKPRRRKLDLLVSDQIYGREAGTSPIRKPDTLAEIATGWSASARRADEFLEQRLA